MPAFIAVLLSWLGPVLLSTLGKFLAALGIGVVSYTGLTLLTDQLYSLVVSYASGVPALAMQFIHMFKLFTALNMILSALAGKYAVEGLKKFVIK